MKIAVLGAGIIGAAISKNLSKSDFDIRVWNRTPDRAHALVDYGVKAYDDATDAVTGADVVITILKDGLAVADVMQQVLPHLKPNAMWLQLSTVGTDDILRLAETAERANIAFYDAPVMGTRQPAEEGKLVILSCGPSSSREKAASIFSLLARKIIWLGEKPGVSTRLKMVLNALTLAHMHGIAEAMAIAASLEVDPKILVEAIEGGPLDSPFIKSKMSSIINGDFAPSFTVANGLKDTELVLKSIAHSDIDPLFVKAGLAKFQVATELGYGHSDISSSLFSCLSPK